MPSIVTFLIGLSLLGLFIWYFGTDSEKRQRWIGTVLTLGLLAFCLYSLVPPKDKLKLGQDLAGGARFTLQLKPEPGTQLTPEDQQEAINVLYTRLNAQGTGDIQLNKQGEDQIIADVPAREGKLSGSELENLRTTLTKAAKLSFHLSHDEDSATKIAQVKAGEEFALDYVIVPFREGMGHTRPELMLVKTPSIVGEEVKNAYRFNEAGQWKIVVDLKKDGADALRNISSKHNDNTPDPRRMAIVLDNEIISAPGFNETIGGGSAQISGDFKAEQAQTLATSMKNPLRTKPEIIYEEFFPPTLAKTAVDQGLRAGIAGLGLTALFMLLFYRFAGIIALVGLTVNVILLFGILAIFQADFTLTGIAGVILTIGITIDANVLIYERLREERAAGKSIGAAIQSAYDKAFSAIFDAQITTLITAMILLWLGAGAIKGFAVTLTIGIIVSLFSALLVTRVCFNWLKTGNMVKDLKFMKVLGKKAIDFLSKAKVTRFVSIALVIAAIGMMAIKGSSALGIQFAGGDQIRFQASDTATPDAIDEIMAGLELSSEPKVQALTPLGGEGRTYSVRVDGGAGQSAADAIAAAGLAKGDVETKKIGSVVAGEMAKKSLLALIVGLIAIFAYVSLRFEVSFAVGAIVALVHDLIITTGIVILVGKEINLIMVGAILTIAGYSINDTIVVFDRIREGLRSKRGDVKDIMNQAINTTLSRTILTSVTTLLVVVCLFLFGGKALNDFSFTIIIGVLVGTYSSIFVASPIVYWWAKRSKTNLRRQVLDADQESAAAAADPTAS